MAMDMTRATLFSSFLALPVIAPLAGVWLLLHDGAALVAALLRIDDNVGFLVGLFAVMIVVHEAIHGITWSVAGGIPLRRMHYGVNWKALTPYCHSPEPMRINAYRLGAAMPGLVQGLLPALAAIVLGNPDLMLFGILFTFAAGGDMLVLWLTRRLDSAAWVQDHPTDVGCVVVEPPPGEGRSGD